MNGTGMIFCKDQARLLDVLGLGVTAETYTGLCVVEWATCKGIPFRMFW